MVRRIFCFVSTLWVLPADGRRRHFCAPAANLPGALHGEGQASARMVPARPPRMNGLCELNFLHLPALHAAWRQDFKDQGLAAVQGGGVGGKWAAVAGPLGVGPGS